LREGDANSKYIHALMTDRRRRNAISSILVDGDRVEEVFDVREAVFNHFEHHFKYFASNTSRVDNFHFHRLSHAEGANLTKPFCLDEIKAAMWDWDNFKSPGLDGIHMGFIKNFW